MRFFRRKPKPHCEPEGLARIVRENINPFRSQDNLLSRGTPAVSFWPMRKKWERYGAAWTQLGTDGDFEKLPSGQWRLPAVLRLTYIVCHDGQVCQLATVVQPEKRGDVPRQHDSAYVLYEKARCNMPEVLSA